jgi:hypothetical protein
MTKYLPKLFNKNKNANSNMDDANATLDTFLQADDEAKIKLDSLRFQHIKDKRNFWIKLVQLIIINIIIIFVLYYSAIYVNKLLDLISSNSNIIWILGTFTLGLGTSILYICGLIIKSIFIGSNKKDQSDVNLVELLSKMKINFNLNSNKQD